MEALGRNLILHFPFLSGFDTELGAGEAYLETMCLLNLPLMWLSLIKTMFSYSG